ALGVVLYEMITGRRPFQGNSKASLMAAILEHDPPPITTPQPLPSRALDRLIRTCLEKNPDDRWQNAHDVLLELRSIAEAGDDPVAVARVRRNAVWIALSIVALVIAAAFAMLWYRDIPRASEVVMTSILPPPGVEFDLDSGPMALSPDGKHLAFIGIAADGKRTLWIRPLYSIGAQQLAG